MSNQVLNYLDSVCNNIAKVQHEPCIVQSVSLEVFIYDEFMYNDLVKATDWRGFFQHVCAEMNYH